MAALGLLDSFLFQRSSCTPRLHALFSCGRGAEEGLDRVFYGLVLSKSGLMSVGVQCPWLE